MKHWQVRADLGDGARMVFGVEAEDEDTAWDKAMKIIGDPGYHDDSLIQMHEILPPSQRLGWRNDYLCLPVAAGRPGCCRAVPG